jgi:hypothetical protein
MQRLKEEQKGQTMQRSKEEQRDSVALFVPLFFFWTLHCLSLCSSLGRCNVCPFILLLDAALFVPLFFFWTLHCLSLWQRPKEEQRDKQCNVQKKNKGTNNATSKRRTKGQTMQRPKEEQKDKRCIVCPFVLL